MGHRSKEAEGRETLFLAADGSWGELEFLQLLRPYDTHRDSARGRYSGKLFVREFGSEDAGQNVSFILDEDDEVEWFDDLGHSMSSPLNQLDSEIEFIQSLCD
jgi:hypothetical protein